MLTKNALQNVMQFFRPWSRDFVTMRCVNKRVHAAYHDHLMQIVNIEEYMQTVLSSAEKEAVEQLERLFTYVFKGELEKEERKDIWGNEIPKALVDEEDADFALKLVTQPYLMAHSQL